MTRAVTLANLVAEDILTVDNVTDRVGIGTTTPSAQFQVGTGVSVYGNSGIVSATKFYGDGSNLSGITGGATLSAGSGDQRVVITSLTSGTMTSAATDAELTYNSGTNTLSATTFSGALTGNSATATVATNAQGLTGTPDITINNLVGVAATFTGLLTYEDVTNIDSIGIITARSGIEFGVSGAGGTITSAGAATFTGELKTDTRVRFNTKGTRSNAQSVIDIYDENGQPGTSSIALFAGGDARFDGTVTDSIGSMRRLGVNGQSGAYAFVVGDAGKIIRSSGSGSALTLNQNIFTAGDMISVFNVGSGNNTVVQGTGVTLYNTADAATGTRTIAAKGMCTIVCTASNEFAISGSQLT